MLVRADTVNLAAVVDYGRPVAADPRQEVIVGGPWMGRGQKTGFAGILLSHTIDDVVRQFGIRVYELMLYDPAVWAAFQLWKAGVLSDGHQLSPAVKEDPGDLTAEALKRKGPVSRRTAKADVELAQTVTDAGVRAMAGLEEPLDETLEEMLDAYAFGCTLAELTMDWAEGGPDKGLMMPTSLVPKPRWSYGFRVDAYNKLLAIRGWTGEGWEDIEPSKFAVLSWKPRHRDPRGRSGFRAIYQPWHLKLQQYPEFGEFLEKFADPSLAVTASPDAKPDYQMVNGQVTVVSVLDQLQNALAKYKGRRYMALPPGTTATLLESRSDGQAWLSAFDRYDKDIFRGILFNSRAIQEAEHGSKNDTDNASDLASLSFTQGRVPLARMVRGRVLRPWVRANWGDDVAARLTPVVSFGAPGNVAADLLTAYASAYGSGFIDEAQLPVIWDRLGLPPIDGEALRARVERKNQAAQAAADARAQPPGKAPARGGPAQRGGRKAA
jgi:hypothetical protein